MRYEGTNLVNFTVIDGHVTKIQETPPSVKVLPAKRVQDVIYTFYISPRQNLKPELWRSCRDIDTGPMSGSYEG